MRTIECKTTMQKSSRKSSLTERNSIKLKVVFRFQLLILILFSFHKACLFIQVVIWKNTSNVLHALTSWEVLPAMILKQNLYSTSCRTSLTSARVFRERNCKSFCRWPSNTDVENQSVESMQLVLYTATQIIVSSAYIKKNIHVTIRYYWTHVLWLIPTVACWYVWSFTNYTNYSE